MADYKTILNSIHITEDDYFSLSQEMQDEIDYSLLQSERFDALLIKAPVKIDITKRKTFPILKIIQNDGIREWQIEESRNLIVSAYNVQTGHLIAKTARKDIKRMVYPPKTIDKGPIPENMSKTSYSTGTELIDIKPSIGIPWIPSQYRVTLICFDWVSNSVDVDLYEENNQTKMRYNISQLNNTKVNAILSLKKDSGKGEVTFSIPEKCTANPEKFTIQGKFIVPVNDCNISEIDKKSVVIPAWIMIVEKNIDQGSAILAKWFITADLQEKISEQVLAEGTFKFTLPELLPEITQKPLTPNNYCCYIVVNGNVFGPEKCNITN
ncbi:MAG TPA: hypothetical protein VHO70_15040 [Chitinispirillaceae bacterium]|nr:hypothetical protein [Chitinispirillaceae bacterium]